MIVLKHYLIKEKTYRYLHSIIDNDLIHTTAEKKEAKVFKKNNKLLKTTFADTDKWKREYI